MSQRMWYKSSVAMTVPVCLLKSRDEIMHECDDAVVKADVDPGR